MSISMRLGILAAAVAGSIALMPMAALAKDCKGFAAVGSGLNDSVATLMALQGAVNVAEARGYTVQGEAKLVSCKAAGIFGSECTAKSHACKLPK